MRRCIKNVYAEICWKIGGLFRTLASRTKNADRYCHYRKIGRYFDGIWASIKEENEH